MLTKFKLVLIYYLEHDYVVVQTGTPSKICF